MTCAHRSAVRRRRADHAGACLDYYRATILRQADGLDADQLAASLPPATMTLGGMLKHLAYVEDWWFGVNLAGTPPTEPFDDDAIWDADSDWDWHSATDDSAADLRGCSRRRSPAPRQVIAADRLARRGGRAPPSPHRRGGHRLRWIMVHMIEEYARHNGHADLIRESIDGATDL